MKFKTLLPCVMSLFTLSLAAQNSGKVSGYAITGPGKGERGWKQVRMIDMKTGAELKSVYSELEETEILNARTGKAVVKKDIAPTEIAKVNRITNPQATTNVTINGNVLTTTSPGGDVMIYEVRSQAGDLKEKRMVIRSNASQMRMRFSYDKPFATTSAACAYDKKHQRLYYTPMGIAQLRYIDLKAKKPTVYYFEDETFGAVNGMHDAGNQITRMVIAADGNGYALSNNGEHLVRFTTGKKPEITDLGAITDEASNGRYSIHSSGAYGGDMVAGKSGHLYLITASRHLFKINISEKTALHIGAVKGLPAGYQTNGAMVEEDMKIIVCSADSPEGYYIFDLNTLQAEKYTAEGTVFNASDLAGSNLLADKKSAKENPQEPVVVQEEIQRKPLPAAPLVATKSISVFPNPVTGSEVKVAFNDLPAGKYMIQLTDLSGKVINTADVNIYGKNQVETFRLPVLIGKGNYLVKVMDSNAKSVYTEKIVIQ